VPPMSIAYRFNHRGRVQNLIVGSPRQSIATPMAWQISTSYTARHTTIGCSFTPSTCSNWAGSTCERRPWRSVRARLSIY
jgi:hypothetical protein